MTEDHAIRPLRERLEQLIAALESQLVPAAFSCEQLVRGILAEYADEHTSEACDRCEQCGKLVMCSFHSVLSVLRSAHWLVEDKA